MTEKDARKYITELFKIVDTNSIVVVIHTGKLRRLYCPFWVICKVDVPPLQKGREYAVEAVKMTLKLQNVFMIEGKAYFVWYFTVRIE
jgi:hypothetical protein